MRGVACERCGVLGVCAAGGVCEISMSFGMGVTRIIKEPYEMGVTGLGKKPPGKSHSEKKPP